MKSLPICGLDSVPFSRQYFALSRFYGRSVWIDMLVSFRPKCDKVVCYWTVNDKRIAYSCLQCFEKVPEYGNCAQAIYPRRLARHDNSDQNGKASLRTGAKSTKRLRFGRVRHRTVRMGHVWKIAVNET